MIEVEDLPASIQKYRKRIEKWSNDWTTLFFGAGFNVSKTKRKLFYNSYSFKKLRKEQYKIAKIIKNITNRKVYLFDDLLLSNNKKFLIEIKGTK